MHDRKYDSVRAIEWRDDALYLIDQRRLPGKVIWLRLDDAVATASAIRDMVVRGAPAIGITAAYGVVLAARARFTSSPVEWKRVIEEDMAVLADARPTAVNLVWALERMRTLIRQIDGDPVEPLLAEARRIHDEDVAANYRMGELGAQLIESPGAVLTHCNAGALATGGYGTALGVVRSGFARQAITSVYADETRPWLQGSRLTAWELLQDDIPVSLIADSAAAWLMRRQQVSWVIVGSDRVAANGDVANKIGTYNLAIAAQRHGVGFMVVAPTSTIDRNTADGDGIPIETRASDELLTMSGGRIAAQNAGAWNPVFDVTPAELVDVLVTEKGVVRNPTPAGIAGLFDG